MFVQDEAAHSHSLSGLKAHCHDVNKTRSVCVDWSCLINAKCSLNPKETVEVFHCGVTGKDARKPQDLDIYHFTQRML